MNAESARLDFAFVWMVRRITLRLGAISAESCPSVFDVFCLLA